MLKESVYILLCLVVLIIVFTRIKLSNTEGFYGNEPKTFTLHVKTAIDKQLGLMHRKNKLKKNHGLLFDYNRYGVFSFWMKDTFIALDILFLSSEFEILDIQSMQPQKINSKKLLPIYTSTKPAKYAIELNTGLLKKCQIEINETISITSLE